MVDRLKALDPDRPIREADMSDRVLDDLVGAGDQGRRHFDAECLGCLQMPGQHEFA
jgi:hypothetical protein